MSGYDFTHAHPGRDEPLSLPCAAGRGFRPGRRQAVPNFSLSFAQTLGTFLKIALTLAACFFFLAPSSAITTRELRIEKLDSEIVVAANGTIDVTENITAHFIGGPWHGLYRDIPVEYVTPQGLNYTLFLTVKSISDGNGNKLRFETSRVRHYRKLKIFVPNADNSTHTISIEYTVSDALRFFEDHDELYWNVTGDEWDVPIRSASARAVLPEGTTNIRANAFTGGYRSTAHDAEVAIAANGVEVRTREALRYHEGLTIAVAFDKGFVHEPTAADQASLFLRSNWPLGLPLAAFGIMFYLWWTRGRDPRLRPIAAQYEPPDQFTPGEAGTLIDNSADMRDITATIVDLAVRGYLVIEEHQHDRMLGLVHDKDYNFILKKDRSEWSKLKPHEQILLNGFFSAGTAGETVAMSGLENHFYKNLPDMKNRIFESLVTHGYYKRRPDNRARHRLSGGLGRQGRRIFDGHGAACVFHCRSSYRRGDLRIWLVHARAHGTRRACHGRSSRFRGFPESRGIRPLQSHDQDARDVREVPAFRHGVGRGEKLEQSVPRNPDPAARMVSRLIRPHFLSHEFLERLELHVIAGQQRPGLRSTQLGRFRLQRRWRVLGRRLRWRWRRRLLIPGKPLPFQVRCNIASGGAPPSIEPPEVSHAKDHPSADPAPRTRTGPGHQSRRFARCVANV